MKDIAKVIFLFVLMALMSCTSDNKVVEVVSGNVLRLSSGDEVHLINVANSRSNYDYLCANLLWQDIIVVEKSREYVSYVNVIHATVYTADSECVNDRLEKEIPVSSPTPEEPRGITPTDTVIPEQTPQGFSDKEWSKPNIKSTKDVSEIYTYVVNVFKRYGVDYMPHIPVIIISKEQMYQEAGNRKTVGLAYTQEFADGEQAFEIHMISGLTKLDFAEVLAHEIMHTWINQNGINISSKADEEGLCNYASYIVLSEVGNDYAKSLINAMMHNSDPIYGVGFRNVKSKIEKIGFHQYLQTLGYTAKSTGPVYGSGETSRTSSDVSKVEIPLLQYSVKNQVISHAGYTVSYNSDRKIPNWVAYELTSEEARGTSPRSNAWSTDPAVNGPQADSYDYKGSGWDRGHMAPAGDMKWSSTAMDESFYYTNIVPQDASLNSNEWRIIEEQCRELAKRYGSVFVACGPIVDGNNYRSIGYNKVCVPDALYKVLLMKVNGEYNAIGFYFRNEPASSRISNYAKTIDEIESLTRIDFFSLLPDDIENKVESSYSTSIWGFY